jgi:hypothetical protein
MFGFVDTHVDLVRSEKLYDRGTGARVCSTRCGLPRTPRIDRMP